MVLASKMDKKVQNEVTNRYSVNELTTRCNETVCDKGQNEIVIN